MDPIAISALILSILSGLGHFIEDIKLYHISCCCVNSDCNQKRIDDKISNLNKKISNNKLIIEKLQETRNSNSKPIPDSPTSHSSA